MLQKYSAYRSVRGVYTIIRRYIVLKLFAFPTLQYLYSKNEVHKGYDFMLFHPFHYEPRHEVVLLEKEFSAYHGVGYALATNTVSMALCTSLKVIGIQKGDEVIVPACASSAAVGAVLSCGGTPVFADIDDSFTLSPASLIQRISSRTKAMVVVHAFGNVAALDTLKRIAKKHTIGIIEDCSQSIGAFWKKNKVGSIGDFGCFSFHGSGTILTGQGGMLITNNSEFFRRANTILAIDQLEETSDIDGDISENLWNLTETQASLVRSQLIHIDRLREMRATLYTHFTDLVNWDNLPIRWYRIFPHACPSFFRLVFMIDFPRFGITREDFIQKMKLRGIPMKVFHQAPPYASSFFQKSIHDFRRSSGSFSLHSSAHYKNIHLPFVESFCKHHVGIEFSPHIRKEHISHLASTLSDYLLSLL